MTLSDFSFVVVVVAIGSAWVWLVARTDRKAEAKQPGFRAAMATLKPAFAEEGWSPLPIQGISRGVSSNFAGYDWNGDDNPAPEVFRKGDDFLFTWEDRYIHYYRIAKPDIAHEFGSCKWIDEMEVEPGQIDLRFGNGAGQISLIRIKTA